jgi:hypothetical protein
MFEKKMVRGILGFEKGKRIGESRRLHNQEHHNLCFSSNSAKIIII